MRELSSLMKEWHLLRKVLYPVGYGKLIQVFYGDFPVRYALHTDNMLVSYSRVCTDRTNHIPCRIVCGRNILESFGHLSERDKSILMKYPFHRIGSLLTQEEAEGSAIVREALASKAGGDGSGKVTLVKSEPKDEEMSEEASSQQVM